MPDPSPPGATGPTRRGSWWARRSLRARLTAAASVMIAVGMVASAALLVWWVHGSLVANLDAALTARAQQVAFQTEHGPLPRPLLDSGDRAPTVQVVAADGHVITASTNVAHQGRLFSLPAGEREPRLATVGRPARGDSDATYRVAALAAHPRSGPVTVYASLSTDQVNESTTELASSLAVGVPVLVVALALVGWLLVGRALRPVEALRTQAAAIPGTDLQRRLGRPVARDELGRLADTLNELLSRIERATGRQRQFVADAAHELRSPIASLQAQLEVTARHPDPAAAAARAEGMLTDTARLSRLVDDLLALARLDANPRPRLQVVDLDDLVLDEARRSRDRGVAVDASRVSAGRVLGDPAALARVVRNLLDNAIRHAAGAVTVRLGSDGATVTLVVADDGPGIPVAERQRVFERFTRLDDARSRDAGGAGLGLAIVADVVASHEGAVRIDDNRPGARFTVTLPAAP
jgi:signal transduction histidine kinase